MIHALCELGEQKRELHDALKKEPIQIDMVIREDGGFEKFSVIEKLMRPAEAITAKKGKARLLLDKAEEVLSYVSPIEGEADDKLNKRVEAVTKKHQLFMQKLEQYKELEVLKPVFLFYGDNQRNGVDAAKESFEDQVDEKARGGNIAFRLGDERLHEKKQVYDSIIEKYEAKQNALMDGKEKICSICGEVQYPVIDQPHGLIKRVPSGQTTGCALVSYNTNAFESYLLKGNYNSSICTNCAKNYVFGLNWLLANGHEIKEEGKKKPRFKYTNRQNFGSDTAMVYWTRQGTELDELDKLLEPKAEDVGLLIQSVRQGHDKHKTAGITDEDQFYSLTLSGAAARIAVRDWIEISLGEYKRNIAQWFEDIAIHAYGETCYSALYFLAKSTQSKSSKDDPSLERTANHLWKAALKGTAPPLWILSAVLKRLRIIETKDDGGIAGESVTPERAALIRIILNRNFNHKGGPIMNEQLDQENTSPAYICGQIFAVMEDIQRAALGKELNAGIRDRFFSAASTRPASAFGRLMKLSQNHIAKIRQDKPGIALLLDRKLAQLCTRLPGTSFPDILSLEEQGQFALGYYHRKQHDYEEMKKNKELKQLMEDN